MTAAFPIPTPPAIGGRPRVHSGLNNKPIHRIVIHSAVMACEPGGARKLGLMNQTSTTGSWHYATDPAEAIQCSWDSFVCWHAPPNLHSLGIEMADWPIPFPQGKRTKQWWWKLRRSWRWRDKNHKALLQVTAKLTAELALGYGLPLAFLGPKQLLAGHEGITVHANVTKAFGESTHWDPGAWPRKRFMRLVHQYANEITDPVR